MHYQCLEWKTLDWTFRIQIESGTPLTITNPNTVFKDLNPNRIIKIVFLKFKPQISLFEDSDLESQINHRPYLTNLNTGFQRLDSRIQIETRPRFGFGSNFRSIRTPLLYNEHYPLST